MLDHAVAVADARVTPGYTGLLDSFALSLRVEGLRPHTVSCYLRDARRLGEHSAWLPVAKLRVEHVKSYLDCLSERVAPNTVAEAQFGLRRFFRYLIAEGEIEADPIVAIKPVKYRVSPQPTYSPVEVSQLIKVCDSSTANGVRDRAIITVLFDTGVRVGELISMGIPD